MPRESRGAKSAPPSREEFRKLRHGRVAWLTAFQPITVAGPRPSFTAFPAPLPANCEPSVSRECDARQIKSNDWRVAGGTTPNFVMRLAILPVWFAFFYHRIQTFLRIFQPVPFV